MSVNLNELYGIDLETGKQNVLGDEDLFKEILGMFLDDHSQDGQKLKDALNANDSQAMKHIAHTLKGVSASIGAKSLYEYAKELDAAINNEESDKYPIFIEAVNAELTQISNSIQKTLID